MKTCNKCKENKQLSEFYKDCNKVDKLRTTCKICTAAICKQYYNSDIDKSRAIRKAYHATNRDSVLKNQKQYRENNKERINIMKKNWHTKNPGKKNASNMLYRARKDNATPSWLTDKHIEEIREFYTICNEIQWLSEEPLHVDHISPLYGKDKDGNHVSCGLHVPWNLQILPSSVNESKGSKVEGWEY